MKTKNLITQALAAALLSGACMAPAMAAGEPWNWSLTSYVWATDIQTDLEVRGQPVGGEVEFSDIIDKLDYSTQMHGEGQGDDFGVFADLTYLALSDEVSRERVDIDTSLKTTIFELAAVWSPGDERFTGFEGFVGLRHLGTEIDAKFDPVDPAQSNQRRTVDKSFTDAMVGVRYIAPLSDQWRLILRGDGSFGSTEGGYNASAIFQYQTAGRGGFVFGYRYMAIDLEQKSGETATMTMLGPIIGYSRRF